MDLSVIIPNFNDGNNLKTCIQSLFTNLGEIKFEIIVIDNGSGDGSVDMLKTEFPDVKVISNGENRFYAAANNQGLAIAQGRYIFFLNSDTEIIGSVVQEMLAYMDKPENGDVGATNCIIDYVTGERQKACWHRTDRAKNFIVKYMLLNELVKKKLPGVYASMEKIIYNYDDLYVKPIEVDIVSGTAFIIRKTIVDQMEGFDERYRLYCTDEEFCLRVKKLGYRIVSVPAGRVVHHHFTATRKVPRVFSILNEDIDLYIRDNFTALSPILRPLYSFKSWLAYKYKTSDPTNG